MAVYGRDDPALFRSAIQSVYDNHLRPDQFVLVADGPLTAELDGVIAEFSSLPAFEVVRLPKNVGLAQALNVGLRHSRHKWVIRADADDFNVPNRFACQAEFIRENSGVHIVGGQVLEVDVDRSPLNYKRVPISHEEIRSRVSIRNPMNHMTVCFQREAIIALGGYPNIELKEDYALWAKAIAAGLLLRNQSEVLVYATTGAAMYRRRGGLRYVRSEINLQRLLVDLRMVAVHRSVAISLCRSLIFAMPSWLRGILYSKLLRDPV